MEIYKTTKFSGGGGPAMLSSGRIYAVKLTDGRFALVEPWCDAIGWEPRYGLSWEGIVDALPDGAEPPFGAFKDADYNRMIAGALERRGLTAA